MKKMILLAGLLLLTTVAAQGQLKREYSKTSTGASSPVFSVTASPDIPMPGRPLVISVSTKTSLPSIPRHTADLVLLYMTHLTCSLQ